MKKLNKKGFTLVELLAVIVILALLMVVAARTIGGALSDSKEEAIQTEAKKLVSKTYEDIQSYLLDSTRYSKLTYNSTTTLSSDVLASGAKIVLTDGNYHAVITMSADNQMGTICIDDGGTTPSLQFTGDIVNNNSVGTMSKQTAAKCAES